MPFVSNPFDNVLATACERIQMQFRCAKARFGISDSNSRNAPLDGLSESPQDGLDIVAARIVKPVGHYTLHLSILHSA